MKQLDNTKIIALNANLKEQISQERKEWNEKMYTLINMLKSNKQLSEAQVYQLSYRQQVQERLAVYRILLEEKKGEFDNMYTARFREYTVGYDIKLNGTEKTVHVNADCTYLKQQVNMIDTQIRYFEECVKTLDNFGFAVRNKIEIISQQLI